MVTNTYTHTHTRAGVIVFLTPKRCLCFSLFLPLYEKVGSGRNVPNLKDPNKKIM